MNKIIHFIKYHNAFSICFMLIFVGFSLSFAASPDFRENFISSQEAIRSVDNSQIISADLSNFNFGLQIKSITEDAKKYYITYFYKTIAIQDYIWQEVEKENTLTVSKEALGDRDLGLYVAEELGEVIDYELSYLKEVQEIEKEKGLTQKIVATQYAGLIGRFLSPEEKVFPGYEPVVPEPLVSQSEITGEYTPSQPFQQITEGERTESVGEPPEQQITQAPVDRELIRQIVQELLTEQLTTKQPTTEQPPAETPPACQPSEEICDGVDNNCDGSVDEGGVCEVAPPPAEDVCDSTHLNLCTTQTECETAAGFWYNETCNAEPEASACVPNWQCSDWQPTPDTVACGEAFTQTRTCADSNNCGTDEGKPIESQDATGNLCSADNAIGTCQEGTCSFTCNEGYQKDENGICQPVGE